jgi:pimeloyl-ACP methyl ester carboxylesterase
MLRWDATGSLSQIGCPVLILGGASDLVTKLAASKTLSSASPRVDLRAVPEVGHMGLLERSDIYNAAVENFVNSEEVARAFRKPKTAAERMSVQQDSLV